MLVYRDGGRRRDARDAWAALHREACLRTTSTGYDAVAAVAIETGELESGIVDAFCPASETVGPVIESLRACSLAAARLLLASRANECVPERVHELNARISSVRVADLPRSITTRPPEGFVYYALSPRQYADAARRFTDDHRPDTVTCIGIRSIGTTLSAVVAAQLEALGVPVRSMTVRPRGHPFDRRIVLDDRVRACLQQQRDRTWFAIVDEGPGLSGSSFASVARALGDVGIPDDRIVFFPAWAPDASTFRSATARAAWHRHRNYPASSFPEDLPEIDRPFADVSAGGWRKHVYCDEASWPAAHPQHEVRKFWSCSDGIVVRYAGLGRYGRAKLDRANALADYELGRQPTALRNGYLTLPLAPGVPASRRERDPALLRAIARHCAFVASAFEHGSVDLEPLDRMLDVNVREALGNGAGVVLRRIESARKNVHPSSAVMVDGRMLAHEWVRTTPGWMKADALDHHDDHFYPGPTDIAWDLAAAAVEFELEPAAVAALLHEYARLTADATIGGRLPYFEFAWTAFRLGYATLACESLGDAREQARFERLRDGYRRRLVAIPNAP